MTIGILAVQGAFIEHEKMLTNLGVECFQIRQKKDALRHMDGLILPGGESTVMGKLIRELDLLTTLNKRIEEGLPVLGTCAGMILLAQEIEDKREVHFGTMPITVRRNAYGRQLGSFFIEGVVKHIGTIPMTFIRAPFVTKVGDEVEILSKVNDKIVAVKYHNQIAISFHPEVGEDVSLHQYFLSLCEE